MKLKHLFNTITLAVVVIGLNTPIEGGEAANSNRVFASAEATQPLAVGEKLPEVTIRNLDGASLGLSEALGGKPALLMFYRGGWCPFCNTHLGELATVQDSLLETGIRIFALSPDKPEKLRESLEQHEIDYTLLSDSEMKAAKAFGIAFRVEKKTVSRLKDRGMDLGESAGQDHGLLPVPSVFLVDAEAVIRFVYSNPDYRVRINPDSLIQAVRDNLK